MEEGFRRQVRVEPRVSDNDFSECPMFKFGFTPLIRPPCLLIDKVASEDMKIDQIEGVNENPDIQYLYVCALHSH